MNKNWVLRVTTKNYLIPAVIIFGSMLATSYAKAESNILFILDASNSMHGQVGGEPKMTAANGSWVIC